MRWKQAKRGQQLNCRKFKSNQEPFIGCWEKHPPRQQNQCVFRQPETRRERGNKCMLFLVGIAVCIERLQQHHIIETIMISENVRREREREREKLDKTLTPHLDKHCNCTFLQRQCDRCDRSLELHVCGRTNSL